MFVHPPKRCQFSCPFGGSVQYETRLEIKLSGPVIASTSKCLQRKVDTTKWTDCVLHFHKAICITGLTGKMRSSGKENRQAPNTKVNGTLVLCGFFIRGSTFLWLAIAVWNAASLGSNRKLHAKLSSLLPTAVIGASLVTFSCGNYRAAVKWEILHEVTSSLGPLDSSQSDSLAFSRQTVVVIELAIGSPCKWIDGNGFVQDTRAQALIWSSRIVCRYNINSPSIDCWMRKKD